MEDKNFIIDYKVDEKTTIPIYDAGTEFYISIHLYIMTKKMMIYYLMLLLVFLVLFIIGCF